MLGIVGINTYNVLVFVINREECYANRRVLSEHLVLFMGIMHCLCAYNVYLLGIVYSGALV
jgi:hypothetical protein